MPDWLLDYGPVVGVVVVGVAAIGLRHGATSKALVLSLGLAINAAALLLRHRAPLAVLAVVLAVTLWLDYGPVTTLALLFAVFTVAEYRDRTTVIVAGVISAIVLVAAGPLHDHTHRQDVAGVVPIALAVAVGLWLRARADYVSGLRERAEQAERERELQAVKAAGEERVRIARELHDVVAHSVSLMVVQAQALEATSASDPEQQAALRQLAGLGREALSEMHRMLGVLRLDESGGAERRPQPGVRDLETLIARTTQAGVEAQLKIEGDPRELPLAVELSAYRIAQEALTNVVRHARAGHVTVTLAYSPEGLRLTVVDDGIGPPARENGAPGGHGLVGMRERVALFGGRLDAGPRPDCPGYRVDARLPTG